MYPCELNSVWQKETEVQYSSLESINNEELSKDYAKIGKLHHMLLQWPQKDNVSA